MPFKDPGKRREATRRWKQRVRLLPEHKEQVRGYNSRTQRERKARWRARKPEYRAPRTEALKERMRRYYQTEKGKACIARWNSKRRARSKDDDLTVEQWLEILDRQSHRCAGCSVSFSERPATRDHIVPVSRGGRLTAANTQALCKPCNSRKANRLA